MAKYSVTNDDLSNWREYSFATASAAAEFIKSGRIGNTFTIWWNTPVTGDPHALLRVVNGKVMERTDVFKLPVAFHRLVVLSNMKP